jgi:hypothetical protein
MVRNLKQFKRPRNNLMKTEKRTLWALLGNVNLTVLPDNKDNVTVIFNMEDYTRKILTLLEDPACKKLSKDPTDCRTEDRCSNQEVLTP